MVALSGKTTFPGWPTDLIPLATINSFLNEHGILGEPITVYDSPVYVLKHIVENL
jgi:hypothetical protein